jgi:CelD/BcsL family acetyltransferase involved in cellulose biosynthesis
MIQIDLVREYPVAPDLWFSWRQLAGGIPMRQPEWLLSWWEAYAPSDAELYLLIARDDDRLVGLIPWYRLKSERQLRLLGDGEVCTDYNGVMCAPDQDGLRINTAFAKWLLEHAKDREIGWDSIYMEGIPQADSLTRDLRRSMVQQGSPKMERNPMNTWCIDFTDGWDGYLARSSKDTRKRLRRRLESLSRVEVHRVISETDWKAFYPILVDLHQKRRNSLGEPGCFADLRFKSFLENASIRMLQLGQLQAFYLETQGQPIAADIGFRSPTHWYCYQGGIEPDAMDLEPGKMANVWMMSQAQSQGIHFIDFLRGDEPYKKQLKAEPTAICNLWIARPGWKGVSLKWLRQSTKLITDAARGFYQTIPIPLSR